MSDVLYKKYGSNDLSNMGRDLQAGQNAMTSNFKGVLADVDGLLKTVEKGYVEDNTRRLQDYLRTNIKNAGLGADAPEMDQISSQFGKLIDKDVLGKTITDTRAKMVADVDDAGHAAAGKVFQETRDFNKATRAYGDTFIKGGANEAMTAQKMKSFYQDNQFMPEIVKLEDNRQVDDAITRAVTKSVASKGQITYSQAAAEEQANIPKHLLLPFKDKIKAVEADSGKRSFMQEEELLNVETQLKNRNAAFDANDASIVAQAQAAYDEIDYNSESASEGAKAFATKMGGLNKAYTEDATGLWFSVGKDILEEEEVPAAINDLKARLLKRGMNPDEADGILFNAYNQSRIQGSSGGVGVRPKDLAAAVEQYMALSTEKKTRLAALNATRSDALERQLTRANGNASLLQDLRKGASNANMYGGSFDITGEYAKRAAAEMATSDAPAESATAGKKSSATVVETDPFVTALTRAKQGSASKSVPSPTTVGTSGKSGPGASGSWGDEKQPETKKSFMQKLGGYLTKDIYAVPKADASTGPAVRTAKPAVSQTAKPTPGEALSAKTDVRRGIVAGYDMGNYATHPKHVANLTRIRKNMPEVTTEETAESYIKSKFPKSPITGAMILATARKYGVEPEMVLTVAEQDSSMGTQGSTSIRNNNPGNVGGDGPLNNQYPNLQAGVDAIGRQLQKRKLKSKTRS